MKKQYINPTISVFQMQMQQHVLAGSGVTKDSDGDIQSVGFGGDFDGSAIKSRQGSIWGDDEEE